MTRRRVGVTAIAILAVSLVIARVAADLAADYAWYDSLGAAAVWRARITTLAVSRTVAWFLATLFALGHLLTVRQSVLRVIVQRRVGDLRIDENVHGRYLTASAVVGAALIGALLALAWSGWLTAFMSGGPPFHELDPYFENDLSFFVFWLPFEIAVWNWALLVLSAVAGLVVTLYILTDGLRWNRGRMRVALHTRRHLAVLAGLFLLLLAWNFRLDMYRALLHGSGPDGLITYVDERVNIDGSLVLAIGTVGIALTVIWGGLGGQIKVALNAVIGGLLLLVAVRLVLPGVVSHIPAGTSTQARDSGYADMQAAFTLRAFEASESDVPAAGGAGYPSVAAAAPFMTEWDGHALRRAFAPGPASDSTSAWIGWRGGRDGLMADVILKPPGDDALLANWSTRTARAALAGDEGQVVLQGIARPAGALPNALTAALLPPVVYPGASGYLVLHDTSRSTTGVSLSTGLRRLVNAWSLQNPSLVGGGDRAGSWRLVTHRDVRERVERIAPFFIQGSTVAPVVSADSLYWLIDLYTASNYYPLAYHLNVGDDEWSYLHIAAEAVVNGVTGHVTLVLDPAADPVARQWVRRFPTLFGKWPSLPAAVFNARPPDSDGARTQAMAIGRARNRASVRHLAETDGSDSSVSTHDAYFQLPGETVPALDVPLLDEGERVRGVVISVGGGARSVTWMPIADSLVRWPAVVERLRGLDSAGTGGRRDSSLVRGPIRAIPVNGTLLFLQSAYNWHPGAAPTLAYIGIELGDALPTRLRTLGGSSLDTAQLHGAPSAVLAQAAALWTSAQAALKRGDWAAWARAFDSLGKLLDSHRQQ